MLLPFCLRMITNPIEKHGKTLSPIEKKAKKK